MKIFQIPFCFYPDAIGGTEIYVEALAAHLQQQGYEIAIVAPDIKNQTYCHQGLRVHRFALGSKPAKLRALYGEGDETAAQNFAMLLEQEKPDLIHLHAFTAGVSVRLIRAARQRRIPVIFTYHTPTVSCQRGTLIQYGSQICTGQIDVQSCARCTLQGLGIGHISAYAIGSLPPTIGKGFGSMQLQGGIWTALRMSELIDCQQQSFRELMTTAEHIVAVCEWVKELLLCNQVPQRKITVLRQGLCYQEDTSQQAGVSYQAQENGALRLVFLGRLSPEKGLHILIQAIAQLRKQPDITLDIYGISQVSAPSSYQTKLLALIEADSRVHLKPPVSANQVISTLRQYDALVVPSQWLETGPLVVLEAFCAGIPVIGSSLGGIAELVKDGVNGLLVEPTAIKDWTEKIYQLCCDRTQLTTLKEGISPPEDMQHVAKSMAAIYQQVLSQPTQSAYTKTLVKN